MSDLITAPPPEVEVGGGLRCGDCFRGAETIVVLWLRRFVLVN